MANILTIACTDNVVTLVLDDATGLVVGETVTIFNTGYKKLDGVHVLLSVNLGTDTVTYEVKGNQDDIVTTSVSGAVLSAEVTWIDADDVEVFLGIATATANDTAFLAEVVSAANCFAFRRRYEAGYKDSPTASPCPSAKMGTVLYASSLYRERGSVDSFQSYDAMSMPQPSLSMGRVLQLLGVGRPQIG
jgi:hypothetical protein